MDDPSQDLRAAAVAATPSRSSLLARMRQVIGLLRLRGFDTSTAEGRSLERYRRILLTTVSGMTARGVAAILGLFTLPIVLGYLGKERFGLWALITTLMAWVSLFDLGLANGLVNMLSAAHGRDEREAASRYLSTAFAALLAVAALLALLTSVSLGLIPWASLLGATAVADDATVRWAVAAALLMFIVALPFSVTQQVYAAYQRTYIWNGFNLVSAVVGFSCVVLAVHLRVSFPVLIIASGIGGFAVIVVAYSYVTLRVLPWLRPSLRKVSREALRGLLSRSVPIFLFQVGALVVNETQSILLAHRCDLSTVAAYSVGMRVYLLCVAVIQMSTNSFIPALREAYERGDGVWTKQAFARLLRVRIGIATAAGLFIVVLGNLLLRLWLRRADMSFDRSVWVAMMLLMIVAMWGTSYAELLSIMDRLWLNVIAVFGSGAATVALTYVLSARYQVLGAIVAMAIPATMVTIFVRFVGRRFLAEKLSGTTPATKPTTTISEP